MGLVSALRPGLATLAVPELERTALYLIFVWVALVGCRRASLPPHLILAGTLTGIVVVCSWGLAVFLFPSGAAPDYFEGRLLYQPLGYANGMGALAAMGVALALGISCHARSTGARTIAAGSLVPLVGSLWFSASRGAVTALAIGLAAMIALDPARRRFLATVVVVGPLPMLAVWLGSRSQVGNSHAESGVVAHSGHVVAIVMVLLTLCAAVVAYALLRDEHLARLSRLAVVLATVAGVAVLTFVAIKGSAGTLGDRPTYWRAAITDTRAHPLIGSGAGSFQAVWLRYRTTTVSVLNAHNLYLETLAELGPLGLALLLGALLVPLPVAIHSRRHPHGGDRLWRVRRISRSRCRRLGLATPRRNGRRAPHCRRNHADHAVPSRRHSCSEASHALAVAATLALTAPVMVELLGNQALSDAQHAASIGDWVSARRHALIASRWQPWSAEPDYIPWGLAELDEGRVFAARTSFAKASRLNPRDWRAWFRLGSVSGPQVRARALERIRVLNPVAVRQGIG